MDKKEALSIASLIILLVICLLLWELFEILLSLDDSVLAKNHTGNLLGEGATVLLWLFMGLLIIGVVILGRRVKRLSTQSLLIATALAAGLCWLFVIVKSRQ
jgi:hypothetical protein